MKQETTKIAGVIGYPISHSLSPRLHNYWLKQYRIDGAYLPLKVALGSVKEAIIGLRALGFSGANVTLPHKEEVMHYCDEVSEIAQKIGAVNTLYIHEGKLIGTNTDAFGFIENLRQSTQNLGDHLEHCFIIGAGGATRAIITALQEAGASKVSITNRTAAKAEELAKAFNLNIIDWEIKEQALSDVTLLVNATSLGMKGGHPLALSLERLPNTSLITDIVYNPLYTDLLSAAQARGNPTVDGLGMLLYQAQEGFAHWFGMKPEVTVPLRSHILEELNEG